MGVVRRAIDVLAVAGVAAAVVASQATDAERTTYVVSSASVPAVEPDASPALAPVTVHDVDPATLAAAQPSATGSVVEVVQLSVVGGSLSLADHHASVTLAYDGSEWTATLPPVRVIDARGTHAGWHLTWAVADARVEGCRSSDVPPGLVRIAPSDPVVVDGTPDGLVAGNGGRSLARAQHGSGGGTYEAGGTVSVRLPSCPDAESVVVELSYSVR